MHSRLHAFARTLPLSLLVVALALTPSCRSAYYGVMEKFGVHKRDILVDRVEEGRDAQKEAKEQFQSALKAFQSVTRFQGGELEKAYDKLNGEYEESASRVDTVKSKISSIEKVSKDLFEEWRGEIGEMHDPKLKSASQRTLDDTRSRYDTLITAMKRAEARMEPVLVSFHDRVLFLKHNLNAQAIASLQGELGVIETDVSGLIQEMEASIAEADRFIEGMGK